MSARRDVPEWAEVQTEVDGADGEAALELEVPCVHVDAGEMYPALLGELRDLYAEETPRALAGPGGELTEAGAECLSRLDPDDPTVYWLEVAYQMMKMDLWVALGTMNLEVRIHDADRAWSQADAPDMPDEGEDPEADPEGRGAEPAAGGLTGPREAVEHYRQLRGVLPAGIRT